MKRILAVMIALFVAVSIAAVPFAADDGNVPQINVDEIFLAEKNSPPTKLDRTGDTLRMEIEPESTLYFSISNARRAEDLNGLRAVTNWSKGEEYTLTPRIEYREMMDTDGITSLGYRYVISMQLTGLADEGAHTLRGTIKLAKRTSSIAPTVSFTLLMRKDAGSDEFRMIKCDSPKTIAEFTGGHEAATIFFYDFGYFDVELHDQGPLNIGCSLLPITDIEERYRDAGLRFISWSKPPIFNRVGSMVIPADESEYLYELRGTTLVDRNDTYQEQISSFVIKTRRLEGFVLSDRPLPPNAKVQPQPNPLNGAG